jgi:hypothetical protein
LTDQNSFCYVPIREFEREKRKSLTIGWGLSFFTG